MNIAIFGPPGVGKSTIIDIACQKGMRAFDLEKEGKTYTERKNAAQKLFKSYQKLSVLFNAADLRINDFPQDTILVLLLPPKETYDSRWHIRDSMYPDKLGQHEDKVYEYFRRNQSNFHLVLSDVINPHSIIEKIQQYIQPDK